MPFRIISKTLLYVKNKLKLTVSNVSECSKQRVAIGFNLIKGRGLYKICTLLRAVGEIEIRVINALQSEFSTKKDAVKYLKW